MRGTAWVAGRSAVTLRVAGVEDVVPNGSRLTIAELEDRITALGAGAAVGRGAGLGRGPRWARRSRAIERTRPSHRRGPGGTPDATRSLNRTATRTPPTSRAPSSPPSPTPRPTDARQWSHLSTRRRPRSATHDRELAGRAVQALVDLRADSRAAGDWAASDRLRDVLAGVGVEVRDSREGSTWQWM